MTRKRYIILGSLFVLLSCMSLYVVYLKFSRAGVHGPRIRFAEEAFDFGIVHQSKGVVSHKFEFTNAGISDLAITKVEPGCSCNIVNLSRKLIPRGMSGEIQVAYDIKNRSGWQGSIIRVWTNDPQHPVVLLKLSLFINVDITVRPSVVRFGRILQTREYSKTFSIYNLLAPGKSGLDIENITSSSEHISGTLISDEVIGKRENAKASQLIREHFNTSSGGKNNQDRILNHLTQVLEIKVLIEGGMTKRDFEERLTINLKNTEADPIVVPIVGRVEGEIAAFPQRLFFGVVKQGTTSVREIEISSSEVDSFKILKVENKTSFISIKVSPDNSGKGYLLVSTLSPEAPEGIVKDTISVTTDNSDDPNITIPVLAIIRS